MGNNALVIAPHADDEAFGMGGTIRKMANAGDFVHLLIMTDSPVDEYKGGFYEGRGGECEKSCEILGIVSRGFMSGKHDALMDTVPIKKWIDHIESILKEIEFDYVFYPYPSHHQDHVITQQACIAALRPGFLDYTPKGIYMYEYTYPGWKTMDVPQGRMYVDITDTINYKASAIDAYRSQLKQDPYHPISLNAMWTLAKLRGLAIRVQYAEMFYVVQEVMKI